jgi:hypothetical protein
MKSVFPTNHYGSFWRLTELSVCMKWQVCSLVRQTCAALVAAAVQYQPTGTGCHALHKTVLLSAVTLLGLVGSFWHWIITFLKIIYIQV